MTFRSLQHNFHDAGLVGVSIGPRREIELEIDLDPVWNETARTVRVRFGGISNFEQVKEFLGGLPSPPASGAYIAEIIGLQYEGRKPYPVVLDLTDIGHIQIESKHVTET